MAEREAGVARAPQHAVHVLPHAPNVVARFLAPALERVAADATATQLLVITPDAETALAIADIARTLSNRSALVPVTAAGRGSRLLASRVAPAIAAAPSTLVSLMRGSAIKLDAVRTVIIAWANEIFDAREDESLEIVLAELPKEASRILVTDAMTPPVEALAERHLRRASRQGIEGASEATADIAIRYVTTSTAGRAATLRRLLDELDPPSVIIVAGDDSVEEARSAIASLGYEGDALVRVETAPIEEQSTLVVLFELPQSSDVVAKVAAASPAHVVALISPRQLPALRRLTAGPVEPLDVSQLATKARVRDERLRNTLRAELQAGFPAREIMALEPLLAEFDGVEIAAAALRLLERDRTENRARRVDAERPVQRATERAPESSGERGERAERGDRPERSDRGDRGERGDAGASDRTEAGYARVFLSIGDRDGVRAGDIVGAIAGESGIASARIGKLEIRDSHTIVEIASADAPTVIEKMTGTSIKGRRVVARADERPAGRPREGRDARRGDGPRSFREGGRGAPREGGRGGPRERRPGFGARGERPSREGAGGRGEGRFSRERPPRSGGRDRDEGRVPRAAREREEWSERADRVRNARRPRRDEG